MAVRASEPLVRCPREGNGTWVDTMYQAELHGKLSRTVAEAEDILTSNVFSFYMYSDPVHLQRLLAAVRVFVTAEDARRAILDFWPTFADQTEPDVVIRVGRYYVLMEAKLHSGYGVDDESQDRHQLLRETRGGRAKADSLGLEFILLTVTDEPAPSQRIYSVLSGEDRDSWRWINWSSIAQLLETGPLMDRMGEDLVAVLRRKGLRRFNGFTGVAARIMPPDEYFFFDGETARFGRFAGFSSLLCGMPTLTSCVGRPLFTSALPTARPSQAPRTMRSRIR